MEIKEFGQTVARQVKDVLGECYTIDYTDVLKNNGVVYHAITIKKENESVAPTIYIDKMFEDYTKKGTKLNGIVCDVVDLYKKSVPGRDIDIDFFTDFAKVSEKLFFKAVNYKKNKKKLENVPIKRVLDLALVPLCYFNDRCIGTGSIMIMNSHLNVWEISKDELWENIAVNAVKIAPPKVKDLMEFLTRVTGQEARPDMLSGIYVVTNKSENYGASAMFYPGVLKEIADSHESDLFIIPSSVHECLVMPETGIYMPSVHLREMIREVNATTVADEEILSDNLYMYERESDRFFVVNE